MWVVGSVLSTGFLVAGFYKGYRDLMKRSLDSTGLAKLAAGTIIFSLSLYVPWLMDSNHPQPSLHLAIAFAVWISNGNPDTRAKPRA
jgi:hypothetical protein